MDLLNLDLSAPEWRLVWPQLIVFLLAVVLVFADAFIPKHRSYQVLTGISIAGYLLAMGALLRQHDRIGQTFQGSFRADGLTVFLSLIILIAAIFSILISANYIKDYGDKVPIGEYYILLAFSVLGALVVSSSGDLITIFVGLELSALATYVLTGFTKRNAQSVEGALKYFLLGIFASAILLYGMSWAYGLSGSTGLDNIRAGIGAAVEGKEWYRGVGLTGAPAADRRARLQDCRRTLPHVDARCLRGCAHSGLSLYVGDSESRRLRGHDSHSRASARTALR